MLDAVAEFLFRTVGAFLLELLIITIGYWPGWLILRILTLGVYPPPRPTPHNEYFVGAIPYITFLVWLTLHYS